MLCEVYCEEFHQKRITFNEGLNVVLGTNTGDNSIGKSTFMLIVDYAFGGESYALSSDIKENVNEHYICFSFKFDNEMYYFSRSNIDMNVVWKCDSKYNRIKQIKKADFCEFLAKKYHLDLPNLTFRNAASRYIRVYGKDNCDEKNPLHSTPKEKSEDAIIAIIKLFDKYTGIAESKNIFDRSKEALSTFRKAQSHEYVNKITKREYENNNKKLVSLSNENASLSKELDLGLLSVDYAKSEKAIELKRQITRTKRIRSRINLKISSLNDDCEYPFSLTNSNINELLEFFPNADLKHIEEVEQFHKKLSSLFKKDIKKELAFLETQIEEIDRDISCLEGELQDLLGNPNFSKLVLEKHANIIKQIEKLQIENESFEKLETLKEDNKIAEENYNIVKTEKVGQIEKLLNVEMDRINKALYKEEFNSPIIHFDGNTYSFYTPDDTGTGIAYKGLIVFDLAVLNLTKLPIIVHDSVVLKQISDEAIENIMNQYVNSNKQVVIAFDKQEAYSKNTTKLLDKYTVLKLEPNGKELFGRSWSKKK